MQVTVTLTGDNNSPDLAKTLQALGVALSGTAQETVKPYSGLKPTKTAKKETTEKPQGDDKSGQDITFEAIRELAHAKGKAGKRTAIMGLLKATGIKTIPDLSKDQYVEFYEKLNEL